MCRETDHQCFQEKQRSISPVWLVQCVYWRHIGSLVQDQGTRFNSGRETGVTTIAEANLKSGCIGNLWAGGRARWTTTSNNCHFLTQQKETHRVLNEENVKKKMVGWLVFLMSRVKPLIFFIFIQLPVQNVATRCVIVKRRIIQNSLSALISNEPKMCRFCIIRNIRKCASHGFLQDPFYLPPKVKRQKF